MKKLLGAFLVCIGSLVVAQSNFNTCGFDVLSKPKINETTERLIQEKALVFSQTNNKVLSQDEKIIPVVVHVIHNGGNENISDEQVNSAIEILNEDYGKISGTNGDGNGVDMGVQFCLAKVDPNGNCTNGIVRIKSSLTNHKTYERAMLKELSFWDNEKYLNMYIVKSISGGVLGYSSFPGGPSDEDGIVVDDSYFGRTGTASNSLGRTTTHEIGHWFGLYHTFNNGCGTDTCSDGDYVCDTPPADNPNYYCTTLNTCSNDIPDIDDQKENYMDYTPDACKNMFTDGQRSRLQATLSSVRLIIWSDTNLIATGCDSNYVTSDTCSVVADFVTLTPELCIGTEIDFIDKSLNNATTWNWFFSGGNPSESTDQNPSVTYDSIGIFNVTLVVSNDTTTDSVTYENYITVSFPGNGDSLSFGQNFDDGIYPPLALTINNYDDGITWELDSAASVSGKFSIKINNLINTNYGSIDELILLPLDFTVANPDSVLRMTFNWAYAKSDANYSDELIVMLSTDCGITYKQVFYRSGNSLATGPTQTTEFVPDSSQWDNAYIYLGQYDDEPNIYLKIVNVTDGGNNLYIDDIYVGDGGAPLPLAAEYFVDKLDLTNFIVYPNPAQTYLNIEWLSEYAEQYHTIYLYDCLGHLVKKVNMSEDNKTFISVIGLNKGIYTLRLSGLQQSHSKQIVIQ